jgi:hypothetical protein
MVTTVRSTSPQSPGNRDGIRGGEARSRVRAAREGWAVAIGLFVLLLAGAALEFSRERQATAAATPQLPGASLVHLSLRALDAPVIVNPGVAVPLHAEAPIPLGASGGPVAQSVTDDRVNSGVWSVQSTDSSTTMRRLYPDTGPLRRLSTTVRPDAVDVAAFTTRVGPVAVLVNAQPDDALHLDLWRLSGAAPSLVGRYDTPALARSTGSQRTVMAAHWSGPRMDLFVVDRAGPSGSMQIRVLSGETRFRSVVFSITLRRAGGFDRARWSADLQDVAGSGRSDLVFTSRKPGTGSGRIEVHVLAAQTNFSRYLLQVPTGHPAAEMEGHRALVIRRNGQATWLLVDIAKGTAVPHQLIAAPPGPLRSP